MTIKVVIADDHTLFRQGLSGLLGTREDLVEVIGEASTGREAISLAERLLPDVVLLDIYMPDGDGLEALRVLRQRLPAVQVVMLTSSESSDHLYEAVQQGAAGFMLKNLDATQLFDLLQGVMRGEPGMTRDMGFRLLKRIAKGSGNTGAGGELLSEREIAVLRIVATGASNQEIAEKLVVSVNTVKSHIRSILGKLQLENRTQAANYAMQHGFTSQTPPRNHPLG